MDQNKERLRVGVIGVGRMGQFHVNAYAELPDVELVGIADTNPEHGRVMQEKFRVEYFRDYRELIKRVDVASVVVPTKLHHQVARDALMEGVHLLVEKPISDNYEKANELFDIAEKRGLELHIGHVERFNGAVQELHKLVEEPILIQCARMGPFDPRTAEDGVVLDLMIHDIDIVCNLVHSDVENINVIGRSVFSDKEDVVSVQITFVSGCMATLTASRATQNKMRTMSITCMNKYVYLDFAAQEIQVHTLAKSEHKLKRQELRYSEMERRERIFVHRENPLKLELRHLIDCINNVEKRRVSIKDELKSLGVALEILESYKNTVTA
ncbi:MAG: oxidoreductase [bacterium]|nr:MAG: oxidoreductase [bacterium]